MHLLPPAIKCPQSQICKTSGTLSYMASSCDGVCGRKEDTGTSPKSHLFFSASCYTDPNWPGHKIPIEFNTEVDFVWVMQMQKGTEKVCSLAHTPFCASSPVDLSQLLPQSSALASSPHLSLPPSQVPSSVQMWQMWPDSPVVGTGFVKNLG